MDFVWFVFIGLGVLAIAYLAVASILTSIFMRAGEEIGDIDWLDD